MIVGSRIIHSPGRVNPWVVQIVGRKGRWIFLNARKTENAARALMRRVRKAQEAAA